MGEGGQGGEESVERLLGRSARRLQSRGRSPTRRPEPDGARSDQGDLPHVFFSAVFPPVPDRRDAPGRRRSASLRIEPRDLDIDVPFLELGARLARAGRGSAWSPGSVRRQADDPPALRATPDDLGAGGSFWNRRCRNLTPGPLSHRPPFRRARGDIAGGRKGRRPGLPQPGASPRVRGLWGLRLRPLPPSAQASKASSGCRSGVQPARRWQLAMLGGRAPARHSSGSGTRSQPPLPGPSNLRRQGGWAAHRPVWATGSGAISTL